jgi:Ca-activated chloride channel family protein
MGSGCARRPARPTWWGLAAAVSGLWLSGAAVAQFSSRVNLVEVYATVTDAQGNPVIGLEAGDFDVYEDGVRQDIAVFTAGDFPLAVALAIDRSASMAGERLAMARSAARTFIEALRPTDRSMLIAVSSEIDVVAPLDTDRTTALAALAGLQAWSTTSLHDAIIRCLGLIEPAPGRRALIVLSDGVDRYSTATAADVVARARATPVLIYPIALGTIRPPLFVELAVLSGGRSFAVADPRRIGDTLAAIATELRHQYLIGYTPRRPWSPGRGEWRALRVDVRRSQMRVRAREGYRVD